MGLIKTVKKLLDLEKTPTPTIAVPRTKCPFYGFHPVHMGSTFMDQKGNECGLKDAYSPCEMERVEETPDWDGCSTFNIPDNKETIERMKREYSILPNEFWPEGAKSWKGIKMSFWFNYVMNQRWMDHIAD